MLTGDVRKSFLQDQMRSQIAHKLRSTSIHLTTVPPSPTSLEYSATLAALAAHILYPSPLPSPNDLPVYILNAAALPDAKNTNFDALLPYVLARLPDEEQLIEGQGYELVFFAGGSADGPTTAKKGRPGWGWFFQAYHVLSRAMRKRLQKLYIVHEKNWIRILIEMFSTAVSPKFRKKVIHASSLSGLAVHIPIEDLLIPLSAYLTDRRISKTIDVPYATGGRAFGVKEPLPLSSNGLLRLPRVLREATMFLIMDPLIKKEGLFRISPRAITVDILAEAYDRAQKFIVWREGDVFLSHGHMKEGTGTVYVDGLDQTEGYEVHAATALIKYWYAQLRDSIFPQSCYPALEKFYGVSNDQSEEVPLKVPQLLELLSVDGQWSPISQTSRMILIMHLLPLLSRVAEFQEWNQMNAYNLSVCLTPCLVRGPDPHEDMRMSIVVRRILTALIIHWKADLAPRFGMDVSKFEDSLRMPEAVGDREDPVQERQGGPRTSLEAQVSGITLVDNESDDEEIDERPPALPPRPLPPSIDTATSENTSVTSVTATTSVSSVNPVAPMSPTTPVRRKPAPVVRNLPRYSVVIRETPATLEHIDSYNSVPLDDFEPSESLLEVPDVPDLPVYESSSSSSFTTTLHASPTSKPPTKSPEGEL